MTSENGRFMITSPVRLIALTLFITASGPVEQNCIVQAVVEWLFANEFATNAVFVVCIAYLFCDFYFVIDPLP